jgi:hypothetical protein
VLKRQRSGQLQDLHKLKKKRLTLINSKSERRETQSSSALFHDKEKIKEEEWNGKGKIADKEGNILENLSQKRAIIFL